MAAAVCGFHQVSEKPAAKPGAENRSLPTICNRLNVRLKIFRGFGLRSASGRSAAQAERRLERSIRLTDHV